MPRRNASAQRWVRRPETDRQDTMPAELVFACSGLQFWTIRHQSTSPGAVVLRRPAPPRQTRTPRKDRPRRGTSAVKSQSYTMPFLHSWAAHALTHHPHTGHYKPPSPFQAAQRWALNSGSMRSLWSGCGTQRVCFVLSQVHSATQAALLQTRKEEEKNVKQPCISAENGSLSKFMEQKCTLHI